MATAFGTLSYKFEAVRHSETIPRSSTGTSRKSHELISRELLTGDKKRVSRKRSHSPSWTTSMDPQETEQIGTPVSHKSNVRTGASSSSNQVTGTVQSPEERATNRLLRSRPSRPAYQADRLVTASTSLNPAPSEPDVRPVLSSLTASSQSSHEDQLPYSQQPIRNDVLVHTHASNDQVRARSSSWANVDRGVQSRGNNTIQNALEIYGQRVLSQQQDLLSRLTGFEAEVDCVLEDPGKRKLNGLLTDPRIKREICTAYSEFAEDLMKEDTILANASITALLPPQKYIKRNSIIEQRSNVSTSKLSQDVRHSTTYYDPSDVTVPKDMTITRCRWSKCSAREQGSLDNLINHLIEKHVPVHTPSTGYFCEWEGCNRRGERHEGGAALVLHLNSHINEGSHTCTVQGCDSTFERTVDLAIHMEIEHGMEPDMEYYNLSGITQPELNSRVTVGLNEGATPTPNSLQKSQSIPRRLKSATNKASQQAKVPEAKKKGVSYTISDDYTGSERKVKMKKLQVLLGGGFCFEKY